jgi:hypothetical protein
MARAILVVMLASCLAGCNSSSSTAPAPAASAPVQAAKPQPVSQAPPLVPASAPTPKPAPAQPAVTTVRLSFVVTALSGKMMTGTEYAYAPVQATYQIRTGLWPCAEAPDLGAHLIVDAVRQADGSYVVTKCEDC